MLQLGSDCVAGLVIGPQLPTAIYRSRNRVLQVPCQLSDWTLSFARCNTADAVPNFSRVFR